VFCRRDLEDTKRQRKRQAKPVQEDSEFEAGSESGSAILSSLPEEELRSLQPHLEPVALPHHCILHEAGERFQFVYFLSEGLASLVVVTRDGRSTEVAVVGREGMVGTPLLVGIRRGPYRVIMQIAGRGYRLSADILAERLNNPTQLRRELNRSAMVQGLQIGQIAACNRLHEIEKRLARWLLMCQDRVDSAFLPVTHEFLAQMLGTGRPSISLAAGILQRAGVITNLRGAVKILNRRQLEGMVCECYRIMRNFSRS
jgi:CRP-like cAMP-binding protein